MSADGPLTQNSLIEAISTSHSKKELTKLPEFSGDEKKDSLSAAAFIARVESAARAGSWSPAQSVAYMKLALTGNAWTWFEVTLDRAEVGWEENFTQVAMDFIARFEPSALGQRAMATFKDLRQKPGEKVQDFGDRLMKIVLQWRKSVLIPDSVDQDMYRAYFRLGMRYMSEYILLTLFSLGLKDSIKTAVATRCPTMFQEALNLALDYETGLDNIKRDGTEKEAKKNGEGVSAIGTPFKRNAVRPGNSNRDSGTGRRAEGTRDQGRGSASTMKCFYCKKPGHSQRYCQTRIRKGDDMKPFPRGRTAAVQEEEYEDNEEEYEEDYEEEDDEEETLAAISARLPALNFLGGV